MKGRFKNMLRALQGKPMIIYELKEEDKEAVMTKVVRRASDILLKAYIQCQWENAVTCGIINELDRRTYWMEFKKIKECSPSVPSAN